MAVFEYITELPVVPQRVFDFLADVRNLPRVSPPRPRFAVIDAPARLSLGARFTVRVWRFGMGVSIESVVETFHEGEGFTDAQVRGPFRLWRHTHALAAIPGGSRMTDTIEFLPPSRPLGWYLTEARLRRDLTAAFAHRTPQFRAVLANR